MEYEIREKTFGEILDTSFALLRNHFVPLCLPYLLISIPGGLAAGYMGSPELEAQLESGQFPSEWLGALGFSVVFGILVAPVAMYGITEFISSHYRGRPVSIGDAWRAGARAYMPLIGTTLLAGLLILLGTLLFVIPGIYLALALALITPIIVIEGRFGTKAISRSRELTKGSLFRIFGLYVVVFVLSSVLNFGGSLLSLGDPWIAAGFQTIASAIAQPFGFAATVVLYYDVRCRKEAFDLEHLSDTVAQA